MRPDDIENLGASARGESEKPYWPFIELRVAANGWIVRRAPDYSRDTVASRDETYVFTSWPECSDFLAVATEPKRPG